MLDRLVHRQPLRCWLFPGYHNIHIVSASQTVIGDCQQTIRVGWQIDAHDFRLLVDHMIDEARILMTEPIVVLSPHVGT